MLSRIIDKDELTIQLRKALGQTAALSFANPTSKLYAVLYTQFHTQLCDITSPHTDQTLPTDLPGLLEAIHIADRLQETEQLRLQEIERLRTRSNPDLGTCSGDEDDPQEANESEPSLPSTQPDLIIARHANRQAE